MTTGAPGLVIPYSSNPYPSLLHSKDTAQIEEPAQIKSLKKSTNMIHCNLHSVKTKTCSHFGPMLFMNINRDKADCVSV